MHPRLVSDPVQAPGQGDFALPGMEPVFWQGADHEILTPRWYPEGPMIEHLAYSVARAPSDLTAHTRRVLLCERQGEPVALFGSLADLFIALGERGRALRRRLYKLARPRLTDALAHPLEAWIRQGRADDRAIDDTHAVLVARPRGRALIVSD